MCVRLRKQLCFSASQPLGLAQCSGSGQVSADRLGDGGSAVTVSGCAGD